MLWNALRAWEEAPSPALADLCQRIRARHLFKTLELFGPHQEPKARDAILYDARQIAHQHGLDPNVYVGLDIAEDVPFDSAAGPPLVRFAKGPPRRLADVSFLLHRLDGEKVAKVRLVFAPELREAILRRVAS